jgi:hypothetical protein
MSISLEALNEAVSIKQEIAALETRLENILGVLKSFTPAASTPTSVKRGPKTMSAAAKAKISAAAKARWAKIKGTSPASSAIPVKRRGVISPEGRARIVAAQKARWAALRKKK